MATVNELLVQATVKLTEAGVDSPRLDAELLLAHAMERERTWLRIYPDYLVTPPQQTVFLSLLDHRLRREPLPYLLGEWEFYGRPLHVSPAVLIPRPETELLVEAVLEWARLHQAQRVADVGTGSGAIAVTLACEMPDLKITAIDISPEALTVARGNAERHNVAERIEWIQGDLLQPLISAGAPPLDIIVANLPYIALEEKAQLMPEVRDHEPPQALFAGEEGTALIRRLIDESPDLLVPGGLLALEVGLGQAQRVAQLFIDSEWQNLCIIPDYAGIQRHVIAESPILNGKQDNQGGKIL